MKTLRAAAFLGTFLFALGAFAVQYPSGQSNPGQSGSSQATVPSSTSNQSATGQGMGQASTPSGQQSTSPAQSTTPSQSASPAQGSTSSQSTQSAPSGSSAQSPSGESHAPGQGMPSIDEQVSMLSGQLSLTPDQQAKAKTILQDQHNQAMTIVNDNAMSRDDKMQKIHTVRTTTITNMRNILTDEQKPKFDQMVQAQNDRMRQQQQGSTSTPNTNTPPK